MPAPQVSSPSLSEFLNSASLTHKYAHSVVSNSLQPCGLQPARLLCPWGFSRQKSWKSCHALFQGIFLTQGSSLHLLCLLTERQVLYHQCHLGRPKCLLIYINTTSLVEPCKFQHWNIYDGCFLLTICFASSVKLSQIHNKMISVQFSLSVVSDSLRPHESQHVRPPCPSPSPGVHPDSRPSSQ